MFKTKNFIIIELALAILYILFNLFLVKLFPATPVSCGGNNPLVNCNMDAITPNPYMIAANWTLVILFFAYMLTFFLGKIIIFFKRP